MKNLLLILTMFIISTPVFASQEGVLPFADVHITSAGIGSSGDIDLLIERNITGKISAITIKAFGKEFNIEREYINKLQDVNFNSIQLSYEHGYEAIGGKVIYIIFQTGFISGTKDRVLLVVKEDRTVEIKNKF